MRRATHVGTLAIAVGSSACSPDPNLATDLNSEGPPEVTLVSVPSELDGESATFCLSGEDVRVNQTLCPERADAPGQRDTEMIADATPMFWFSRVVFSELLNPDIEELVDANEDGIMEGSLLNTQPVVLTCGGVEVPYDGFYDPSGNDVTFPPGPALLIEPADFVATGSKCSVAVRDRVVDKGGNAVVADNRGPFEFQIAPLSVIGTLPEDQQEMIDPAASLFVGFNAPLDATSLVGRFVLRQGDTEVPVEAGLVADDPETEIDESDPTGVEITAVDGSLLPNTQYTLTVSGIGIADVAGGEMLSENLVVTFTTGEPVEEGQ